MMECLVASQLRLGCGSRREFEELLAGHKGRILGVLAYAAVEPGLPFAEFPCVWVELPQLEGDAWYEMWVSDKPVTAKGRDPISFSSDGDFLFGCLVIDDPAEGQLESQTYSAYSAIFDVLDREGYPELLRTWNYFPRINETGQKLERYREFNLGRHEAFFGKGRVITEGRVPAACALGSRQGDMVVCFLAGKIPGVAIENPRQTNAYRYPQDFGPRSPTFARGMLAGGALFISGTASIIGSETVHVEDVSRQLEETIANLHAVIAQARKCGFTAMDCDELFMNVYLRHAADYPRVRDRLVAEFGGGAHIAWMQADVCRADLLVEIEAFWMPGL